MRFDFCVGNPPYQGDNHMQLYPDFYLSGQQIADCVEMIFPTGWQEPKKANNLAKMNREAVKEDEQIVLIDNRHNAFPSVPGAEWTNIVLWKKGYDNGLNGNQRILTDGDNERIEHLSVRNDGEHIPEEMKGVVSKVLSADNFMALSSVILRSESYRFSDKMHEDNPSVESLLSRGHKYDLKSSVLSKLDGIVFFDEPQDDGYEYVEVLGLSRSQRVSKWIRIDYIIGSDDFYKHKLFVAEAAASGKFGEKLSDFIFAGPKVAHTQTFISIGCYDTEIEVRNVAKYLKGKFARALLFTLKNTQHNGVNTWANIPIQDFSLNSDIDWNKKISEIDQQLYHKYGLSQEEIDFIEAKVKEMD